MNLKKLSLFMMIFILAACGGKGKDVTKANIVILGGIASGIPGMTGGTKVFGYNTSTGDTINLTYSGQAGLPVPNGVWEFAAITWDGNTGNGTGQIMEGDTFCGVSEPMPLFGGEVAINITLSNSGCNDSFFGDSESKEANGEPKKFRPLKCLRDKEVYDEDSSCTPSVADSFQVQLPDGPFGGPGLTSRCIDADTPVAAEMENSTGELRIPIISWFDDSFPLRVRLFDGAGCTGTSQDLQITNAYAGLSQPFAAKLEGGTLQGDGSQNDMRIDNNPCLHGEGTTASPFNASSEFIICTPAQVSGPGGIAANLAGTYQLNSDLDFSALSPFSTSLVSGTFTGELHGNGHTISNVTIVGGYGAPLGLFSEIDGPGSTTSIEDLKLSFFDIDATDTGLIGALAGSVSAGTLITRVQAEFIDIDLTRTAGSYQGVGGLIGMGNIGTTPNPIEMHAIKLTNVNITVDDQYSHIGGIIGRMNDSNYLRLSSISDISIQAKGASDTGTGVGGAVGYAFDNDPEIYGVVVENLSIGNSTTDFPSTFDKVGGVLGEAKRVRVLDTKVTGEIYSAGIQIGGTVGYAYTDGAGSIFDGNVSVVDIYHNTGSKVGGFAGEINTNSATTFTFSNNRSFGSVDCEIECGGFVGKILANAAASIIDISDSYSKSDVSSSSSSATAHIGGFAGFANRATGALNFTEVFAVGDVLAPTAGKVGGFAGRADYVNITDSYYRGTVTGTGTAVGGLIGDSTNSVITRAFASGSFPAGYECIGTNTGGTYNDLFYESTSASDVDCPAGTGGALNSTEILDLANLTNFTGAVWEDFDSSTEVELGFAVKLEEVGETYTGSFFDPIILTTADQWNSIGDDPDYMKKTYKLEADISFGGADCGAGFEPIGSTTNPFVGRFQGNDHIISDISCTETSGSEHLGLFRNIYFDTTFGNGQIEDFDIFGVSSGKGLYIDNVSFTTDQGDVGTLVGSVTDSGTASSPHNHGMAFTAYKIHVTNGYISQTGAFRAGGLIGQMSLTNENSHVIRSSYEGTVSRGAAATGTGGLFGRIAGGPLSAGDTRELDFALLNFNGDILGTGGYAGGIIGELDHLDMEMAYAGSVSTSTISANGIAGGFVGLHRNGVIRNSFAKADVTCSSVSCYAGGFAGHIDGNTTSPQSYGNYAESSSVTATGGTDSAGCFAGNFSVTPVVYNNFANCDSVSGATSSYWANGAFTLNNGSVQAKNAYAATADEVITGADHLLYAEVFDPVAVSANTELVHSDPWIHLPGDSPRLFWEVFPDVLAE